MPRPTLTDDERRTVRKQFRFSPAEWRALAEKALKNRIYVAEQIRWEGCGVEPPRRQSTPFRKALIRAQGSIGKMLSNVRQIVRAVGELPESDPLRAVDPDLGAQAETGLQAFSDHLLDVLTTGPLPRTAGEVLKKQLVELDLMGTDLNDLARALNRQLAAKGASGIRVPSAVVTQTLKRVKPLALYIIQFTGKEITHDGDSR